MKFVDHSDVALSENMPRQSAFTNFAVALVDICGLALSLNCMLIFLNKLELELELILTVNNFLYRNIQQRKTVKSITFCFVPINSSFSRENILYKLNVFQMC